MAGTFLRLCRTLHIEPCACVKSCDVGPAGTTIGPYATSPIVYDSCELQPTIARGQDSGISHEGSIDSIVPAYYLLAGRAFELHFVATVITFEHCSFRRPRLLSGRQRSKLWTLPGRWPNRKHGPLICNPWRSRYVLSKMADRPKASDSTLAQGKGRVESRCQAKEVRLEWDCHVDGD